MLDTQYMDCHQKHVTSVEADILRISEQLTQLGEDLQTAQKRAVKDRSDNRARLRKHRLIYD